MWAYERVAGCWQWVWRTRPYWRGLGHVAGAVAVCGAVSGSVPHALAELPVMPAGLPSAQLAGWSPWATLEGPELGRLLPCRLLSPSLEHSFSCWSGRQRCGVSGAKGLDCRAGNEA
jgi:hypothetical protein